MISVAVTGGIGSGKSVVCKVFQHLGIPIFNADFQAKQLMQNDPVIKNMLLEYFGTDIYRSNGELDRKKLAKIIFNDQFALQKVNQLVHPAVYNAFQQWASQQVSRYVIQEAAVIFENNHQQRFDKIITVTAPNDLKINRTMQRDNIPREAVLQRIQNQLPDAYKVEHSNFTVINDDVHLIIPQILAIHKQLMNNGKIW